MATAKIKHVVADAGAFIRNAPLRDIGDQIYTLPSVVAEIKDKATIQRLQFLPYQLEYRVPSPEDIRIVTEFSKKSGDYPSLSATDIQVLALTYLLEKENVGTEHIKLTPDTKIEINLSQPQVEGQRTQIAGFYLGSEATSNSATISEGDTNESTDVETLATDLDKQTITETEDTTELSAPVQEIYSEQKHNWSIGGQVNKLTDDEEFPVLSRDLFSADEEFPVLSRDLFAADEESESGVEQISTDVSCPADTDKTVSDVSHQAVDVVRNVPDNPINEVPVVPQRIFVQVRDEITLPDSDDVDYPSLVTGSVKAPSFIGSDGWGLPRVVHSDKENNAWSKVPNCIPSTVSYAKMTVEGETRSQPVRAQQRMFHEGHVLSSDLIEEGEEGSDDEEDEDEEGGGVDEDGWITPSNIQSVKKKMGMENMEKKEVVVGCLTTDFAIQNVLIQMGMNVVSIDGYIIKRAKSYVLRCFACFKVTSKMRKMFCPHCGNRTLKRIAITVNDDGTIKYYFSRRKQLTSRGLRQSLPAPQGGKHSNNPILVEDQPRPHQRPTKKALQQMDVFDPDYTVSESPFRKHDVTSRAAQLGIMWGQRGGRKQPGARRNKRK